MEESEKRRERLRAMRMEAAQAGASGGDKPSPSSAVHGLANPLIEPFPMEEPRGTPRFDYYTDPMSAFSTGKRRSHSSHRVPQPQDYYTPPPRPRIPELPFSPSHQPQASYLSNQPMHQAQGPCSNPYRSPVRTTSPFGMMQETPDFRNGSGGSSCYRPSNLSDTGIIPNPCFGHVGSPTVSFGQGRGHMFKNNLGYGSGRGIRPLTDSGGGRGRWPANREHRGLGWSRGRQTNSHSNVSGVFRAEEYFNKSMLEDPWKFLKPIIWRTDNISSQNMCTPEAANSWLPNSLRMKKARVSETSNQADSQPSLAEYLAASFNEVVDSAVAGDKPGV